MKTLEVIRKMDGVEKRLADLTKDFNILKAEVNGKKSEPEKAESKKVDKSKSNTKKFKE